MNNVDLVYIYTMFGVEEVVGLGIALSEYGSCGAGSRALGRP